MTLRRWVLFLLAAAVLSLLAGCGGGTFDVQNPPPPPPPGIAIAFQSTPPQSIPINTTTTLVADVTNDSSNAGVDWALTCATAGSCGTISALHTDSGAPVTYTPPEAFVGNSLPINIVAYATANQSKNADAAITVTAFGSVLQGTYVFQAQGSDSTVSVYPYQLTGAIYLDGSGNVASPPGGGSAGQQTLNSLDLSGLPVSTPAEVTGGTYFIGGDGRGSLTLNAIDPAGNIIVENFSLVVTSAASALIAQQGGTITPPGEEQTALQQTGSGTLELQDPVAASTFPTAGYAFVASGTDINTTPIAYGGIVNVRADGTISGIGNLVDVLYANNTNFSTECAQAKGVSGTLTGPGPFGTVILTLDAPKCFQFNTIQLTGYIVDSTHIRLIETDGSSFLTGGLAVGQGAATGTFTNASLSGAYVFGVLGMDLSDLFPSSLISADVINTDGAGNIPSAIMDTFLVNSSEFLPVQISDQFTATYQVDSAMIGRAHLAHFDFATQRTPTYIPDVTLFLTGSQPPALVLFGQGGPRSAYPSLGIGTAYSQQANASFPSVPETYGLIFTQQSGGAENDGSGQMLATPNTPLPGGTLVGAVDQYNSIGSPQNLVDTFDCPQGAPQCPDAFGRYTNSTFLGFQDTYYLINPNQGFVVETDFIDPGTGQVGLGYFTQACNISNCTAAPSRVSRKHVKAKRSPTSR